MAVSSPSSLAQPGGTGNIGNGSGYYGNSDWSGDQGIFDTSAAAGAAVINYQGAENAAGQQEGLAGQIGGQIGYYQGMQAPTMSGAQLGAAPTASAAQNSFNAQGPMSQGAYAGPAQLAGQVNINTSQDNQDRAAAMQNINALQQQAAGQGPSVAAQQAQASSQQAIAGQMAAAASQRGSSNASLGLRSAQTQAAANQQATAQTAVQGRLQEQLNAQSQLGSAVNNLQGQDIGLATNQAGLTQQTNLANSAAQNNMNLSNAQLAQSNSQYNAGLGLSYNQLNQSTAAQNAQLQQQTGLANQAMQGQYGLQQGQFNQATDTSNLQAQLGQEGLNNQMVSGLYGQEGGLYGSVGQQQLEAAQGEEAADLGQQSASLASQQFGWSQGIQAGGLLMQGMSMSDEDEKTNIATLSAADQDEEDAATKQDQSIGTSSMAAADKVAKVGSAGGSSGMSGSSMSSMMSMFGGGGGGGGGAGAAMSDEKEKKDVEDDDEYQTQSFLDALKAKSFEYKDKSNGVGRFTGVMAQDLEKNPIGKQAVVETPKGKVVDYARLASVMLAGQVLQNEQIKQLKLELHELKGNR
jgi:Chaperone of endosialidase